MIAKRWIEVDDGCLGPDKQNSHWVMYLFVSFCVLIKRKRLGNYVRRRRNIHALEGRTKKELRQKLEEYMTQPNVFLKEQKK